MALVLVVEHFGPLRRVLQRMLESRQHRVLLAADGMEGLKRWREHGADVMIFDLPGPEAVKELETFRTSAPTVPIISTASSSLSLGW